MLARLSRPRRPSGGPCAGVVRLGLGLGLGLSGVGGVAQAGPAARGRAITIERSPGGAIARACVIGDGSGMCPGRAVKVGERATVVDDSGVRGLAHVTQVRPLPDDCGQVANWAFEFVMIRGQLAAEREYRTWALFDLAVSAHGRIVDSEGLALPEAPTDSQVWLQLDRDGDREPDFASLVYACDHDGTAVHGELPTAHCVRYFTRSRGAWSPGRRDRVPTCLQ